MPFRQDTQGKEKYGPTAAKSDGAALTPVVQMVESAKPASISVYG